MKAHLNLVTVNALEKFSDLENGVVRTNFYDHKSRANSQELVRSMDNSS
jgi:hypothetical protein